MRIHPYFPRAKLIESTNFECVQFKYQSVDYQSLHPWCVLFSQYWDESYYSVSGDSLSYFYTRKNISHGLAIEF